DRFHFITTDNRHIPEDVEGQLPARRGGHAIPHVACPRCRVLDTLYVQVNWLLWIGGQRFTGHESFLNQDQIIHDLEGSRDIGLQRSAPALGVSGRIPQTAEDISWLDIQLPVCRHKYRLPPFFGIISGYTSTFLFL